MFSDSRFEREILLAPSVFPLNTPQLKKSSQIHNMRKYEGVIVLNIKGNEEGVDKLISDVGREIETEGAKLEQIDKMGKRDFAYNARHLADGYYVNYQFQADADTLPKVQNKLKLNSNVHLQHYQRRD